MTGFVSKRKVAYDKLKEENMNGLNVTGFIWSAVIALLLIVIGFCSYPIFASLREDFTCIDNIVYRKSWNIWVKTKDECLTVSEN